MKLISVPFNLAIFPQKILAVWWFIYVVVQTSEIHDVQPYFQCHGENTGIAKIALKHTPFYRTCLRSTGTHENCAYRCSAIEQEILDPHSQTITEEGRQTVFDDFDYFSRKKDLFKEVVTRCLGNLKTKLDKADNCRSFKTFVSCMKYCFKKVCDNYKGPPDYQDEEEEDDEKDWEISASHH